MNPPEVRCPVCTARVRVTPGATGRVRCTDCEEEFEASVPAFIPEPPPPPAPARRRKRKSAEDKDTQPQQAPDVAKKQDTPAEIALGCVILLVLATGIGLAIWYFVFRSSSPEDIVKKVKTSTVYIRTTHGPGQFASGSGFFAGKPGYVLTNAHVVGYGSKERGPATSIQVVVNSGEKDEQILAARIHGVNSELDLALLQVQGQDLPACLSFGKAADLVETQEVVIFGYPFGETLGKNISVNRSTVSSLRKERGKVVIVQLAGGLNPGNSGGPVTDTRGKVIGVSVARFRETETIAFAIPAEVAAALVEDQLRSASIR